MISKYPFHRWLALPLLIVLLMTLWPGVTHANGGSLLFVERLGAYYVRVAVSPYPPQVGLNDISVLLSRASDAQVVLDAEVTLTAEPLDQPGETQTFPATHATATLQDEVEALDDPAAGVVRDDLAGLIEAVHGHSGQQQPAQGLDLSGRMDLFNRARPGPHTA